MDAVDSTAMYDIPHVGAYIKLVILGGYDLKQACSISGHNGRLTYHRVGVSCRMVLEIDLKEGIQ